MHTSSSAGEGGLSWGLVQVVQAHQQRGLAFLNKRSRLAYLRLQCRWSQSVLLLPAPLLAVGSDPLAVCSLVAAVCCVELRTPA